MMETIKFECEVITPMFLGGADGKSAELRAPSIKGALRFWWRAMNGHLPLDQLHKEESKIFGDGGTDARRSPVTIRIVGKKIEAKQFELVPHKPFMKGNAISPKEIFEVIIASNKKEILEKTKAVFILTSLFGGFGKRVRRGMGSIRINKISDEPTYKSIYDIGRILEFLKIVNPDKFRLSGNSIISDFKKNNPYPYIRQIEIGRPDISILKKISNTSHEIKEKDRFAYEASLGHAYKGRFASPIYVSTIKTEKGLHSIITTLNAAPIRDMHKVNRELQEDFKRSIL